MVLTAGRERPSEGDDMQKGEGVAIVLLGPVIDAWKRAGKQWKTWGPRAVSACLQVGEGMKTKLHVLSCYAPTRAASRQVKNTFYQKLESILAAIPTGEKYVILGDFNAHVGSREFVGDRWGSVRCTVCGRWFRSRGGIAVHRCGRQHQETDSQDDNTHTNSNVAETASITTG